MRKFDGFWLKAAGLTNIYLIIPAFSAVLGHREALQAELTKPAPSTIVPANSIGSSF
jgi:hypothetical protein